jgi:hypothetical protein
MLLNRRSVMVLFAVTLLSCLWLNQATAAEGEDGKGGSVTGVVTAKGKDFIKVRSEGDKEPKQYMPNWKGGNDGGLDKDMLEKIGGVPIGSVVKISWKQDEHLRVTALEVVKKGEGEHKEGDRREKREGREHREEGREHREEGREKRGEDRK